MSGYSYFHYDQMTIFEVEVHSEQLECLKNAANEYEWETIKTEVEPLFKEAALDFRAKGSQSVCSHKQQAEDTLNIDNTHLLGYSTPGTYVKECRECDLFEDCEDKVSTDETADWNIKGKHKCYYAHQVGMSQLAGSGAPVGCVVLNRKQYDPDSLRPLLVDVKENHSELSIEKVNGDDIFNNCCFLILPLMENFAGEGL